MENEIYLLFIFLRKFLVQIYLIDLIVDIGVIDKQLFFLGEN